MNPILKLIFAAIAIVVVPIALYLLAGWAGSRHRGKCPQCGAKKLRLVQSMLATVHIGGKRAPDHWSYHECEACHSRWKEHRGEFLTVTDDEWQENCGYLTR